MVYSPAKGPWNNNMSLIAWETPVLPLCLPRESCDRDAGKLLRTRSGKINKIRQPEARFRID